MLCLLDRQNRTGIGNSGGTLRPLPNLIRFSDDIQVTDPDHGNYDKYLVLPNWTQVANAIES